jgi:MFS family permease
MTTLRQRDFLLAWLGGLISMMGDWVLFIALPIYIYQLTDSALATSGMFVAGLLPSLLLGSFAGVFVDRWDRKRTMIASNLVLAAIVPLLLLLRSDEWVWIAYVVSFAQASVGQFFRPAENAFLPRLVADEHLLAANSLNALNNNLARLAGPAVGGALMASFGLQVVAIVDAVSFLAAAALVSLIHTSGKADPAPGQTVDTAQTAWRRIWSEWAEGIGLLRRHRVIGTLLAIDAVSALGEGVFSVMFVVWVHDVLKGGSEELGWLMSAQAVGGLLGGALLGSVIHRFSPARIFAIGSIVFGILDLALFNYPLYVSGIWIGIVLIGLVGIPTIGVGAGFMTLLQQAVKDAYRGRIFGIRGSLAALLQLVGTLIGGALGGVTGPIVLLNIQGGSYVLVGILALVLLPDSAPHGANPVASLTETDVSSS